MTTPATPYLPQQMPLENALSIVSDVCGSYRGTRSEHQTIDAAMGTILGTLRANQTELLAARQRITELEGAKPPASGDRSETIGMSTPE